MLSHPHITISLRTHGIKGTTLLANKKQTINSTKISQRFLKSHTSKLELIDYFRRKKGTTDNAIPETTKRITKGYLGSVVSLPDSSVIY